MMGWKQRMERAMLGFVNQQKTMQDIADALTSTINYGAVDIKTPSREAWGIVLSRNCFIEGVGSDKLFTKGIPGGKHCK